MSWRSGLVASLLVACPKPEAEVVSPPPAAGPVTNAVDRASFNRIALEVGAPWFWVDDTATPGTLDPGELEVTWGPWDTRLDDLVQGGAFTPAFAAAYAEIATRAAGGWDDDGALGDGEARRRAAVRRELGQGRPTLIRTDLRDADPAQRQVAEALVRAADGIEVLYDLQLGSNGMLDQATDGASRMVIWRNHGPWCAAPATESDPDCRGLADTPPQRFGLYPADLQEDTAFCDVLQEGDPHLLGPFTAVRRDEQGELVAVPFSDAWPEEMEAVRAALLDAAGAVEGVESEAALHAYLLAAAKAFADNSWFEADRAWAAMNAHNSAWYLRVGPDETYFEPCNRKAGFHLTLARINPGSLEWHQRLEPLKQGMEDAMADLAGPPYAARDVAFHLPDFIDIVLNAGDDRANLGGTSGQSLPNWGPVSEEGGRTVAMTNLDDDPDGRQANLDRARSVLCADAMGPWSSDPGPLLMTTLLHEAAHNLGPAQEYRVDGRTDEEVFGGPLASMFEELKAQTAALYFTDWLAEQGAFGAAEAESAHLADLVWALAKVAQGMYTPDGRVRTYSQLAAIQVGALMDSGALVWQDEQPAANGEDLGCMAVDYDALPGAIDALAREVVSIKARLDTPDAEALRDRYVHDEAWLGRWEGIRERWLRSETASYGYAIDL